MSAPADPSSADQPTKLVKMFEDDTMAYKMLENVYMRFDEEFEYDKITLSTATKMLKAVFFIFAKALHTKQYGNLKALETAIPYVAGVLEKLVKRICEESNGDDADIVITFHNDTFSSAWNICKKVKKFNNNTAKTLCECLNKPLPLKFAYHFDGVGEAEKELPPLLEDGDEDEDEEGEEIISVSELKKEGEARFKGITSPSLAALAVKLKDELAAAFKEELEAAEERIVKRLKTGEA